MSKYFIYRREHREPSLTECFFQMVFLFLIELVIFICSNSDLFSIVNGKVKVYVKLYVK